MMEEDRRHNGIEKYVEQDENRKTGLKKH